MHRLAQPEKLCDFKDSSQVRYQRKDVFTNVYKDMGLEPHGHLKRLIFTPNF